MDPITGKMIKSAVPEKDQCLTKRKATSFMDLYLKGEVLADDIDDFVDEWHENRGKDDIFEFLG